VDAQSVQELRQLVQRELTDAVGKQWLSRTESQLLDALLRRSFNTERAIQVYEIAIERVVMSERSGAPMMALLSVLRREGIVLECAEDLVDQFKARMGATDQRRARKGIWAALLGK
jgi:hypothetical protein